eukprot:g9170.t1
MTLSEYLSLMSSSGEDTSPTASDPTTICPLSSIDQEGSSVMDEDCGADVTSPEVVSVLDPKGDCNEGGSSSTGSEDEDHDDGANADPSCVVDEDDVRHFAAAVDATESAHGERGTECESDAGREPDGEGTFRYNLHYDMLNYVDETGRTPLMWLLVWKQERAARALIRRADFRMLNVKDKWGGMVLTLAVPLHALFLETVRRRSRDLELECLEDVLKTGKIPGCASEF